MGGPLAMDGALLQLNNFDASTRWWLLIAAVLTIVYAVMRPMRKKKDPLARPPSNAGLAAQRAVERDMSNLLVELSEMARQVTGQLDTRAKKLELLIQEADERLAALAQKTTAAPAEQHPLRAHADVPPPPPPIDPRHLEIYALADQGRQAYEIAHRLNRPRGEIELILALRGRTVDV